MTKNRKIAKATYDRPHENADITSAMPCPASHRPVRFAANVF